MKKKILSILSIFVLVVGLTGCNSGNSTLNKIVKKFNNCKTVKSYKEYGYDINAKATKDKIIITTTIEKKKSKVEFKLDKNILSNDNLSNDEMMTALILIDSIGQVKGYKDGELIQNLNAFSDEIKNYTIDKEGIEFVIGEEKNAVKIDITKKIPLIDMNNFYLKTTDFDMIKQIIADNEGGNQSGKSGNIAYDVFVSDNETTIKIGQDKKLGDSAYKSILSALEVLYGKDKASKFEKLYPKFLDKKTTVDAFTIETNYEDEDKNESVFKNTEVVLVTIDNSKIK